MYIKFVYNLMFSYGLVKVWWIDEIIWLVYNCSFFLLGVSFL